MKLLKTSLHVVVDAEAFAKRAEAIFERYDFKWAGKTFGDPDYLPTKAEILDRVNHLIDRAVEVFDEYPTCNISTQSMGRIVVIAHRSPDTNILYDVSLSLDIT